ncbi:MAG: OmpH family outer membrane protein [Saprospiraceae bacterium]|nr:OmpH family outer membrane protein [Saprospiraceae bacterium]
MFRKTPFAVLITILIGATTLSAQAQPKYGHMNLGNLLELLPDTKKANVAMKVYTDSLSVKDSVMTKAFQEAYAALEKDYNAGILTPVQAQTRQEELKKQQESIQKFEQDAQQMAATKREQLLTPILAKVEGAIKEVAKEKGYLMIFDTSSGVTLFAAESDDVTALVKQKLGL